VGACHDALRVVFDQQMSSACADYTILGDMFLGRGAFSQVYEGEYNLYA